MRRLSSCFTTWGEPSQIHTALGHITRTCTPPVHGMTCDFTWIQTISLVSVFWLELGEMIRDETGRAESSQYPMWDEALDRIGQQAEVAPPDRYAPDVRYVDRVHLVEVLVFALPHWHMWRPLSDRWALQFSFLSVHPDSWVACGFETGARVAADRGSEFRLNHNFAPLQSTKHDCIV